MLYCTPHDENYYEKFDGFVEDGTPCFISANTNSLCLQGVCQVRRNEPIMILSYLRGN